MRGWRGRVLLAAALVAVVFVLRATLFKQQPVEVEVAEVGRGPVEQTVTNSRAGTVKARQRAKLSPEIGGQVVAVPLREGDRVKRGDVLLRLEDSVQRARLRLAERELQALEAERRRACLAAERAGRELERIRRLAGEEIVSADLLDGVESAKQTADAGCQAAGSNVARAEAAVELARTELDKMVLRAPFDGVVAEISTEVGEWTTPSPPALPVPAVLDLLDPESIYVSAPMDEVDSARIQPGQPARVTVDSHRGRSFAGRVERIAPYVLDLELQNRTLEIEVSLDDAEFVATLLPGTSADVEVILEARDDALRIPTQSLMEGDSVLVLAGERLEQREVATGLRNWDYTEIRSGLEAGERVVVSLDRAEVKAGALARAAGGEA